MTDDDVDPRMNVLELGDAGSAWLEPSRDWDSATPDIWVWVDYVSLTSDQAMVLGRWLIEQAAFVRRLATGHDV